MAGLIDNILDFARERLGGGITLTRDASEDLEPVLAQVVNELRSANPDRLIETEFALKDPNDCNRSRIGQMASNPLGNALTDGAEDRPVRLFAATEGGILTPWVANHGQPIPESAIPKLFEPFVRGEVRDIRKGLGLGLHIASQIATAHESLLSVTSDTTETRFTFVMSLPRQ